jgi:hypothetical protein
MYSHAPEGYACPFCYLVRQEEANGLEPTTYLDDVITAYITLCRCPDHPGHTLVIPNEHLENICDLLLDLAAMECRSYRTTNLRDRTCGTTICTSTHAIEATTCMPAGERQRR